MSELRHWFVTTPTYYVAHGEYEPGEDIVDFVSVVALNKEAAKVAAVRALRSMASQYMDDCRVDERSPFAGLKVEDARCEHGSCWCDACTNLPDWRECGACMDEADAQNIGNFV